MQRKQLVQESKLQHKSRHGADDLRWCIPFTSFPTTSWCPLLEKFFVYIYNIQKQSDVFQDSVKHQEELDRRKKHWMEHVYGTDHQGLIKQAVDYNQIDRSVRQALKEVVAVRRQTGGICLGNEVMIMTIHTRFLIQQNTASGDQVYLESNKTYYLISEAVIFPLTNVMLMILKRVDYRN